MSEYFGQYQGLNLDHSEKGWYTTESLGAATSTCVLPNSSTWHSRNPPSSTDLYSGQEDSSSSSDGEGDATSDVASIASSQTSYSSTSSSDESSLDRLHDRVNDVHVSSSTGGSATSSLSDFSSCSTTPWPGTDTNDVYPSHVSQCTPVSETGGAFTHASSQHPTAAQHSRQHGVLEHKQPLPYQPGFCNRRRRASYSTSGSQQPVPTLKRDTDSANCLVQLLITLTCRLLTAYWPTAAAPPMMSTCFNGAGVLPLHTFIYETLRRSKTSYSTLQIALFYLIMLRPKLSGLDFTKEQPGAKEASGCRAMQCGRRMFLSALMLASKYIQDRNYSTRAWSKISGLRIPEINENERQYLKLIGYSLHIKQETFENWSKVVLSLSKCTRLRPDSSHQNSPSGLPSPPGDTMDGLYDGGSDQSPVYTNSWWNWLCKKLDPEVFKDSVLTEAFMARYVPQNLPQEISALPFGLSGPSIAHMDMTFSDTSGSGQTLSNVSTPIQMAAASPTPQTQLPMRPNPRKLQTPQSTPQNSGSTTFVSPTSKCPKAQNLRCSASVDALRSYMRRQAFHANTDRCPPPAPLYPQATSSATAEQSRPVESPCRARPATAIRRPHHIPSAGPSPPTSPERCPSVIDLRSHASSNRSRSSSVSSTTSHSSTSSSLYSISPCNSAPRSTGVGNSAQCTTPTSRESGTKTPLRPMSAVRTTQKALTPSAISDSADVDAICALMDLRSGGRRSMTPQTAINSQNSTPKASQQCSLSRRGHKRTCSKMNDRLQDNVRNILLQGGYENEEVLDAEDKQTQMPHCASRPLRRPVSMAKLNKRMALDCSSQQRHLSASRLASANISSDISQMLSQPITTNWLSVDKY